jgi:hypothetical protein
MYATVTAYARIPTNDEALADWRTLIFRSGRDFLDIAIFRVIGVIGGKKEAKVGEDHH